MRHGETRTSPWAGQGRAGQSEGVLISELSHHDTKTFYCTVTWSDQESVKPIRCLLSECCARMCVCVWVYHMCVYNVSKCVHICRRSFRINRASWRGRWHQLRTPSTNCRAAFSPSRYTSCPSGPRAATRQLTVKQLLTLMLRRRELTLCKLIRSSKNIGMFFYTTSAKNTRIIYYYFIWDLAGQKLYNITDFPYEYVWNISQ